MATTIVFEDPPGKELSDRVFRPGQKLRIGGKVTGLIGLGEPFTVVRLTIAGDGFADIFKEGHTDIFGNYWFDLVLPDVEAQATVEVISTFTISGQDDVKVPIAISSGYSESGSTLIPDPGATVIIPGLPTPPQDQTPPVLQVAGFSAAGVIIGLGILFLVSQGGKKDARD